MTILQRASRLAVIAIVLPLLTASHSAAAAQARRAAARAAAAKPAVASTSIIPLPLSPVIPAAQRLCTAKTPTGLGYAVLRPAAGAKPGKGDVALVNYIGYLAATGAVFDQGMRSPLGVDGVIPGFAEGLQLVARAGIVRLCIPAALGYGARATGPIPANADLVFQVELLDFKSAAEVEAMRKSEPGDAAPGK